MDINDLDFQLLPRDAGQIVEITYAIDWESSILYSRTYDRNDRSTTHYRADVTEAGEWEFDPENGVLPGHGEWTPATAD